MYSSVYIILASLWDKSLWWTYLGRGVHIFDYVRYSLADGWGRGGLFLVFVAVMNAIAGIFIRSLCADVFE